MTADSIPDDIAAVDESIIKEILACKHGGECDHQCTTAFRITPDELRFYKKQSIPLPLKCPNCRHYERLAKMPPLKLWPRACMCKNAAGNPAAHPHTDEPCANEFETPYAPGGAEIVYCEECYNAEIA
jgi:hypothetical protein